MNRETLEYVRQHADDDVRMLALRGCKDPLVQLPWALDQIAGRQQARHKLPSWALNDGLIFPPHLAMEQCSSEATARYKAEVARQLSISHDTLVDLTGGFGVDCSFMAAIFARAIYVERQEHLCQTAIHNFGVLGIDHAQTVCDEAEHYLQAFAGPASLFFLDPARRDGNGQRTYAIADCTPNVTALLPLLMSKSEAVMLKLSPMLDWRKAVADLGTDHVSQVHLVAAGGECKELLLVIDSRQRTDGLTLYCADEAGSVGFSSEELAMQATDSTAVPAEGLYLYEPGATLMKAGCFAAVGRRYGLDQIAPNSHLFVGPQAIDDFPGRRFRISAVTSMNKRELRQALAGLQQANISVRNFPMSPPELRKRLHLTDGGSTYLFATTLADRSHTILLCHKA